jgi:hypothetical protein
MDPTTHGMVVEAVVQDCAVELYVNDIPVGLCGIGASRRTAIPIHEFLIDGTNELAMLVNPGDSPQTATDYSRWDRPAFGAQPPPDPAMDAYLAAQAEEEGREPVPPESLNHDVRGLPAVPGANAAARIAIYEVGATAFDGTGVTLLELEWAADDDFEALQAAKQPFPLWVHGEADLGSMFGPQHWQQAERLRLDDRTHEEVVAFVLQVQQWVENGEAQPILDISRRRFEEVSAAYGISEEERVDLFRQLLEQESGEDYWIFETPEDDDFDLRLCGNNRLIECIAKDWRSPIRGVPDPEKGRFLFPMIIGKLPDHDGFLIMR